MRKHCGSFPCRYNCNRDVIEIQINASRLCFNYERLLQIYNSE